MGLMDDFETSLQVLRGFDTDISVEVHEIKVYGIISYCYMSNFCYLAKIYNSKHALLTT
jgi:hypothetical protein